MMILYILLGIAIGSTLLYLIFGVNVLAFIFDLLIEIVGAVFSNWD